MTIFNISKQRDVNDVTRLNFTSEPNHSLI